MTTIIKSFVAKRAFRAICDKPKVMRIELDKIDRHGSFAHVYAPHELSLNDEDVKVAQPAEVAGTIARSGAEIQVRGNLTTVVETSCDRCTRPVSYPVKADFDLTYVTLDTYTASRAEDLSQEDLRLSVYDGVAIDLDELVREEILLALPTHILCREDCRGLCPHCGVDHNETACDCADNQIDPRWAALQQFKPND